MKGTPMMAVVVIAACLGSAVSAEPPPTTKRQADAAWAGEGLEQVEVKGLDRVYIRPGASLEAYDRVQLEPVSVAFRRDWGKPASAGTHLRVRDQDIQRIKEGLSALVEEQVRIELADGGYALAEAGADDVLAVELSIVNLYINAPDLNSVAAVRTYTTSVGEMTLVAELRDSVSGELLARILDRSAGRDYGRMQLVTRVDNVAEAKSISRAWAKALRSALDKARAEGH